MLLETKVIKNISYLNQRKIIKIYGFVAIVAIVVLVISYSVTKFQLLVLEPDSTAGLTSLADKVVSYQYIPGKRNVLVLGDSRVGEGFSPNIANAVAHGTDINFVRLGVPGTTPRVWYYLLRHIDPQKNMFERIYLMSSSYSDTDVYEELSERTLDTAYLMPLLKYSDVFTYPTSFYNKHLQEQAVITIFFPQISLKKDFFEFLKNPVARVRKNIQWKNGYPDWLNGYLGREERLPEINGEFSEINILAETSADRRDELKNYFDQQKMPATIENIIDSYKYRSMWYGGISEAYRKSATSVNVFIIPRGPYHTALQKSSVVEGSLKSLYQKKSIDIVPSSIGISLEEPCYFFDQLHLNKYGRDAFSKKLAQEIITQMTE